MRRRSNKLWYDVKFDVCRLYDGRLLLNRRLRRTSICNDISVHRISVRHPSAPQKVAVVVEVAVPLQFPSMWRLLSGSHESSWRKHQINKASAATAPPNFPLSGSCTDFFCSFYLHGKRSFVWVSVSQCHFVLHFYWLISRRRS